MDAFQDYDCRMKVFLFGGLFFVAGCFIGLGGYFNIKSDSSLRNDQWICLTGNVVRFSHNICVSSSNGGGGGNLFSCEYSYEIGGKQYRSDQLCIGLSSVDEQRKIEKRIKNNTVPVWVNANNPSVSVLVNPKEHGYWGSILLFAVALCMFIGAVVIWFIAVWENQGEHKDQSLLT